MYSDLISKDKRGDTSRIVVGTACIGIGEFIVMFESFRTILVRVVENIRIVIESPELTTTQGEYQTATQIVVSLGINMPS
jgi:hypothetical protein